MDISSRFSEFQEELMKNHLMERRLLLCNMVFLIQLIAGLHIMPMSLLLSKYLELDMMFGWEMLEVISTLIIIEILQYLTRIIGLSHLPRWAGVISQQS